MRPLAFLIDDDEDILDYYTIAFQHDDKFDIRAFDRVEKALAVIDEGVLPDVFIVDIMMPGMNGIEFTEVLHESDRRRPVVVVSGYAQKEHAIRALNAGAFALLEKPVPADIIVGTAKRAVAYYRSVSTAERLLGCQGELITNMERIKSNYENRLISLENQVIELKGKLVHDGLTTIEVLGLFKQDREINALIVQAKQELELVREHFSANDLWR